MKILNLLRNSANHCKKCLQNLHQFRSLHSSFKVKACERGSENAEVITEGPEEFWPRRIVSGIQPTGTMHIGNYFGAVRRCVRLQQAGDDLTLFIADLHSLTTHQAQGGGALPARVRELAALLLAAGADAARGALFAQSAVPRHAELCWLLACVATQARLQQLPQFRERAAGAAAVPLGLLLYPVLQAADVLVYAGTHVPVGRDQLQHLQLAAHLARAFRRRHGAAFPVPAPLLPEDGSDRLLSLRDPSKKMSKSDPDPKSRILLTDSDDQIRLKLRKAVTDCAPHVSYEPAARPGVSNLVALHCLAADKLPEEAVLEAEGLTTAQYKGVVADALCEHLAPVRARYQRLRAREGLLRDVLRHGAVRARARADETYARAAALAGLR